VTGPSGPAFVPITIRPATPTDAPAVADVYLASFHATYDFPLAHTDDQVREWLARVVVPAGRTWVAVDGDRVVGMAVIDPGELDQLYVAPDRLGTGIGTRLLEHAKRLSPHGLGLYTFQVNDRARRFYERHGFVVESLGDGSANEEGQPDVRYVWRPTTNRPAGRGIRGGAS
jgi:ribosomal protein S18 acetylase RimI-like enzyme